VQASDPYAAFVAAVSLSCAKVAHTRVSDAKACDMLMCSRMSNLCDDIAGKVRVTPQLSDSIVTSILESPARIEGGQVTALRTTARCLLHMAEEWRRQGHDIDVMRWAVGVIDRLMASSRLAAYINKESINSAQPLSIRLPANTDDVVNVQWSIDRSVRR
jgi:hypothetical protein